MRRTSSNIFYLSLIKYMSWWTVMGPLRISQLINTFFIPLWAKPWVFNQPVCQLRLAPSVAPQAFLNLGIEFHRFSFFLSLQQLPVTSGHFVSSNAKHASLFLVSLIPSFSCRPFL